MERTLNIDEVLQLVKQTPEKIAFDWKTDFTVPNDENKQGEFIKDVAAVANGCSTSYGFIVYGVDPRRPNPVVGISASYDDAKLQQLITGKIEPRPDFLYYEVAMGAKLIGVVQVNPTGLRPHIIQVDIGKVRRGQILIRRGSSTDGATMADLYEFFYGQNSAHFRAVSQRMAAAGQQMQGQAAYLRELREQANQAIRDMELITGIRLR